MRLPNGYGTVYKLSGKRRKRKRIYPPSYRRSNETKKAPSQLRLRSHEGFPLLNGKGFRFF